MRAPTWLRTIRPGGWAAIGFGAALLVILLLLLPVTLVVQRVGRPLLRVTDTRVVEPQPVCPGDLVVVEYTADVLQPGNHALAAGVTWYHVATKTRYVVSNSLDGSNWADGRPVDQSHVELRVPLSIPPGESEIWRSILGQRDTMVIVGVTVLPPSQCPATELDTQEDR